MEQSFGNLIVDIFKFAIFFGIFLTIMIIVFQGIKMINSKGDPSALSKAKGKIKNTLIGLGVLLFSYALLYTINPDLVNIKLDVENPTINPFNPSTPSTVSNIKEHSFKEIPLGTIIEELLAGVSSVDIPCYEYETKLKEGENIIVGNVKDQNGDGIIDEKDVLLNKDLFYCMKLLTDAYNAKVGYHLAVLTEELHSLMENNCKCSSCYTGRMVGAEYDNNFGYYIRTYGCNVAKDPNATYDCNLPYSYCRTCCGTVAGCPDASAKKEYDEKPEEDENRNPFIEDIYYDEDGNEYIVKQYKYDPCDRRMEITCKSQEIRQLVAGEDPDKICYIAEDNNGKKLINLDAPKPERLLTLNEAVSRIKKFKEHYERRSKDLKDSKSLMMDHEYDKITLAEFSKLQSEASSYKIIKTPFSGDYDISRYCKEYNKRKKINNKIEDPKDDHPCSLLDGERYYLYDGDEATFYINSNYNIDTKGQEKKCTTMESTLEEESLGIYRGEIPIGETVTEAIIWGDEAVRAITEVYNSARQIESDAKKIYKLSDSCECKNCKSGNYGWYWYGKAASCSKNYCSCSTDYTLLNCEDCVPRSSYSGKIIMVGGSWYAGCGYYYKREKALDPAPTHWVCPYEKFCDIVKNIYWSESLGFDEQENNCFKEVKDPELLQGINKEKAKDEIELRNNKINNIGYLQRFDGYSGAFLGLANLNDNNVKKGAVYNSDVYKSVCPSQLRKEFNDEEDSPPVVNGLWCPYNYEKVEGDGYDGSPVDCSGGIYGSGQYSEWNCPPVGVFEWYCYGYFKELEEKKEELEDLKSTPIGDGPGEVPQQAHNYLNVMINAINIYHESPGRICGNDDCWPDPKWGTTEEIEEKKIQIEEIIEIFHNLVNADIEELLSSTTEELEELIIEAKELKSSVGVEGFDEAPYAPKSAHNVFGWAINEAEWLFTYGQEHYSDVQKIVEMQKQIEKIEEAMHSFEIKIVYEEDVSFLNKVKEYVHYLFGKKQEEETKEVIKYPEYYSLAALFITTSCKDSYNAFIANRFNILEKLEESRSKLGRCVKGYGSPYKENSTEIVEIFGCTDGIRGIDGLFILPTFPWPDKSKEAWPYYNCYPYNSDRLTKEQKRICFYNPLREGTEGNPGCLKIIEGYMDNYYCCN